KALRQIEAFRMSKRKGYRSVGIRIRLDKRRTARERARHKMAAIQHRGHDAFASPASGFSTPRRFPFHDDDLIYRHMITDTRKESNAAVLCRLDTSRS